MGDERILQFVAQIVNFFGIGQGDMSCLGEFEAAADRAEQGDTERLLEQLDLSANGLRGEMEPFGSARHAAGAGNGPEIMEMLEVHGI